MPFKPRQESGIIARGRTFPVTLLDEAGSATEKMDMSGQAAAPVVDVKRLPKKASGRFAPFATGKMILLRRMIPTYRRRERAQS
ncbi:hypothetical protein PF050_11330 [Kosakonia pseudosacchari]|uniref:hypothetical protein n=1 Tax=Kosakonia pseudosacchari TaxID=1646340 RepID=UPI0022F0D071|nr:hypothetical protein [Kosakonia pseudosacchari]WBU51465.1 hypothetical protein PF050_11330 [Kosakonia pseudosacchari]